MHIAIALTENYVDYACVLIKSALKRNLGARIHVLHNGISTVAVSKIINQTSNLGYAEFYKVDASKFHGLPVSKQWPDVIYYRLLLPEIIEDSVVKIIYMDCDTLVRSSLSELWNVDLENRSVAAVRDKHSQIASLCHRVGANYDKGYFNSGVLLINLDFWRKNQISKQTIDYMHRNSEKLEHPDQDALNHCLADSWLPVPPKWNYISSYQNAYYNFEDLRSDLDCTVENYPAIIHFTEAKPWSPRCKSHFKIEYHNVMREIGLEDKIPMPGIRDYFEFLFLYVLDFFKVRRKWVNYKL